MPHFSTQHRDQLVNEFWENGTPCCPHDGARLDARLHPVTGGYLLVLACNQCGKKSQVTRLSDPRVTTFRSWTPDEKEMLAQTRAAGLPASCPVCSAGVDVHSTARGALETMSCLRCGNACWLSAAPDAQLCVAM